MGIEEIVKRIYRAFFAIWSLTGVAVCIVALLLRWEVIVVPFFFALFFVAFLTSLTYVVFYSKNDLSIRQLITRLITQFVLVMGIVLAVGYFAGWVTRVRPLFTVITVVAVVVIFTAVSTFEMLQSWRLAGRLNLKLKERAEEQNGQHSQ